MEYICGDELFQALEKEPRVYLCGELKKPQSMKWISDGDNEIGMSFYKDFTHDAPHLHTTAKEYNFVISGCTKVLLIDSGKTYTFGEGSLFVIPPMTKYASKHSGGTRVLFFKSPGGNDKHLIQIDAYTAEWLAEW